MGRRLRKAAIRAWFFSSSLAASVEVELGAAALMLKPREPYSSAYARVKFETPPFAALYALIPQSPPRPDAEERLTIEPFVFER